VEPAPTARTRAGTTSRPHARRAAAADDAAPADPHRWRGEQKTLRLVARYAQACNLFNSADLGHKLDVLRAHCATENRDYDDIEKNVLINFDVGANGENVGAILDSLRGLAAQGFAVAHGMVRDVETITPLQVLGRERRPGRRRTLDILAVGVLGVEWLGSRLTIPAAFPMAQRSKRQGTPRSSGT